MGQMHLQPLLSLSWPVGQICFASLRLIRFVSRLFVVVELEYTYYRYIVSVVHTLLSSPSSLFFFFFFFHSPPFDRLIFAMEATHRTGMTTPGTTRVSLHIHTDDGIYVE